MAHKWAEVLCHPCVLGGPLQKGTEPKVAHKRAEVLCHPYVGDARAVRAAHHVVRARCIRFPRARTTFSFPLCCFLHLTTICPSLVVSPCAVAAG